MPRWCLPATTKSSGAVWTYTTMFALIGWQRAMESSSESMNRMSAIKEDQTMMSNMEAEAIRMMKAKNGSYATVGTRKFKLQCSPRREKEYALLSYDLSNPNDHVNCTYISWKEFDEVKPA